MLGSREEGKGGFSVMENHGYDPHPSDMHMLHDFNNPSPPDIAEAGLCAGCGGKIIDRYYLLAIEKQWHMNCLKCAECHIPLDSELTCFAKDGHVFCKEDYYRKFAVKACARCQLGISASELVMRARDCVYHLNCFSCVSCNKLLATGEHFGMKDEMIFCKVHYEMVLQGEFMPGMMADDMKDNMMTSSHGHNNNNNQFGVPFYNGVGATQKGRPRKRKNQEPNPDMCLPPLGMDDPDLAHLGPDGFSLSQPRQKRIRTSFKHHQLRILKSYFALNQNPDAKDLKQLAQKTGLTKRVLQVWFQNARAKYRRNLLRQDGGGSSDKIQQDSPRSSQGGLGQDSNGMTELPEEHSPPMTDLSSTPSLADLHPGGMDHDTSPMGHRGMANQMHKISNSSLTDIFSSSMNAMN